MSARDPLDVRADVVAAHAAGVDIDDLCAIYRLDRKTVEEMLEQADAPAQPRRSRWLAVVSGRRRRRPKPDTPHTAAS